MSWVGNIIGAVGSYKIGKSNQELFNKQADLNRAKKREAEAIYNNIDRPRLIKQQNNEYSQFFVDLLAQGFEFKKDQTTFFAAQEFKVNQATDLAIADYNQRADQIDFDNQSLLLEAKGRQEYAKGLLVATSEGAKAVSGYQSAQKGS